MKHFPFLFLFFSGTIFAQEKLTLQQAIEIGLNNNYSITIAKNLSQIASNNVTIGNAGMLPQVNLGVVQNNGLNNTQQTYSNGSEVNRNNASAHSVSATVELDWTLFDGLSMFASYNKLQELEAMGALNARQTVENTVSAIIAGYYEILRQRALLAVVDSTAKISEVKLLIAKTKYEIGSSSKAEYLQAQVDMNSSLSSHKRQLMNIDDAKVRLNQLLARSAATPFEIDDSIGIDYSPVYEDLRTRTENHNTALLLAQRNISFSNYSLKELRGERFPWITFNTGYAFSKSNSQASFVMENKTYGLNYGFTVNYNIFNGFNLNRSIRNAKISLENSRLLYSDTQMQVDADLLIAYRNFQNNLDLLKLEQENLQLAKENITLSLERFRVGTIDALNLKEAQQTYTEAALRLVSAKYQTKMSENDLKRITGQLIE